MSPNHSGTRTYKLTRITPHCMVGQMTAQDCGNLFAKSSYQASSNYGIGKDGEIGLYVDEKNRSWCTSSADNDNRAITIECASDTKHPYAMNMVVWDSLVNLCADICERYGKKKLLWLGDKSKTLSYTPAEDEMVLTAHRWFAAKACPGDWLYERMGRLAEEVTKRLKDPAGAEREEEHPNTAAAAMINNEEADREKQIWSFFAGKGLNANAIAGLMGNLYAESALRPNNLQNSFEKKLGMTDKGYTTAVNTGTYTGFVNDGAGYGLAQWTWHTRKKALLDYAKEKGASIDDMQMQLEFLWKELQGYKASMEALKAGKSVQAVSDAILTDFEKPADQSAEVKGRRAAFGKEIYDRQTGAVSEPKKTVTAAFTLQFGAFGKEENAKKKCKELKAKGIDAVVVHIGSFWKVRAGSFETAAQASAERTKLSAKKITSVIVEV